MTREERERELHELMQSDFDKFVELYRSTVQMPLGQMPPPGMVANAMVEAILEHEFPAKDESP